MRTISLVCAVIFSFAAFGQVARATPIPPAEKSVTVRIDEFFDLMQNERPNRVKILHGRLLQAIDLDYLAKSVLMDKWTSTSAVDKQRFKDALVALIESSYKTKSAKIFDKIKVVVAESVPNGDATDVKCVVKQPDTDADIEVVISLKYDTSSWRVQDVNIDGLSILEEYRSQFREFLKRRTLEQLITRLHERTEANLH